MKVIIWISTIIILTLLNEVIRKTNGIALGPVLLWIVIFFVAGGLCKAWSHHNNRSDESEDNSPEIRDNSNSLFTSDTTITPPDPNLNLPKIKFCRKCGASLGENSTICNNCGTSIIRE